ncbi:MAG: XRE family transcriptional regulator [Allosphingosinicella sp.]
MTYPEFLAELDQAALNVRDFAALVQMHPNSVSNYARSGVVPAHLAVIAALLAELRRNGIDHQGVFSRIRIAAKRPRGAAERGRFGGNRQERLGL